MHVFLHSRCNEVPDERRPAFGIADKALYAVRDNPLIFKTDVIPVIFRPSSLDNRLGRPQRKIAAALNGQIERAPELRIDLHEVKLSVAIVPFEFHHRDAIPMQRFQRLAADIAQAILAYRASDDTWTAFLRDLQQTLVHEIRLFAALPKKTEVAEPVFTGNVLLREILLDALANARSGGFGLTLRTDDDGAAGTVLENQRQRKFAPARGRNRFRHGNADRRTVGECQTLVACYAKGVRRREQRGCVQNRSSFYKDARHVEADGQHRIVSRRLKVAGEELRRRIDADTRIGIPYPGTAMARPKPDDFRRRNTLALADGNIKAGTSQCPNRCKRIRVRAVRHEDAAFPGSLWHISTELNTRRSRLETTGGIRGYERPGRRLKVHRYYYSVRVLIVPVTFPSPSRPGSGIAILRQAQATAALGHDVSVFTALPAAPPVGAKWSSYRAVREHDVVGGIPVHTVRVPMLPRLIAFEYVPLLLRPAFEAELDRVRPDIVHAAFLLPGGQLAVRQQRVPVIVTAHGYDAYDLPNRRAGLKRACMEAVNGATCVTAVSAFLAEHLQRLTSRPIDVIWNAGDESVFYPRDRAACRQSAGLPLERAVVLFAGHVVRAKGIFELIEAIARLDPAPRPLLVVAGSGSERADAEALATRLGIEVRFLGAVEHARIPELFGAADIVALPSYYEGLPAVVCEAMLSGRTVVATTAGGIPEVVQHERTGLLVPAKEIEPLAEALRRCTTDTALRNKIERNALLFAQTELTWKVTAQRYERLYEQVLAEWRSRSATIPNRTQYAS